MASLSLGLYRFGIEWARVEPVDGTYSWAAIEHYRLLLLYCKEKGLQTMVTLHHFTQPMWFTSTGGFAKRADRFARYVGFLVSELGSLIDYACTINEINLPFLFAKVDFP